MAVLSILIAFGVSLAAFGGQAMEQVSDQDAARAGAQAGRLMNFGELRDRVGARVGGRFLGCDCNPDAARYRMRFMRGNQVIEVDVDARNGDILRTRE
jgi:uncharacterized membrane protein YkoI|tara:strand:- start:32666 stop:32959 length:294 start_codon:yes stop_codon:yes gene_type:complete